MSTRRESVTAARGTENAAQQVLGLHNGRAFIRLISYALRTGSGLTSVQIVFLALLIFSAAVSWWIARRYVSSAAALLLLLWYLQPIAVTMRLHVLTKATILPLPLALYYASVALLAESGGAGAAAVASGALAAAISAELSCMILVPLHVAFVALFARRPFATCLASCMVLAFTFTLDSSAVSREILGLIAEKAFGLTVLAATVVVLALSPLRERAAAAWVQLRERVAALPVRSRWRAVMKATVIYANTAVWIGCVLVQSRGPQEQYHGPLVFGLLFLAVDACESLSRRMIIVLSLLGSVALVLFAFARVVFGVHIQGSFLGFLGVCAAFSLMTAAFGLMVAALGKTIEATRGYAVMATLLMVMLGGAWVPTFVFPQWLQKFTIVIPTRWAMDGIDAMTWRGLGLSAALAPVAVMLLFTLGFGIVAVSRFSWQAAK